VKNIKYNYNGWKCQEVEGVKVLQLETAAGAAIRVLPKYYICIATFYLTTKDNKQYFVGPVL
jgi:hypothetical protein